MTRDESRVVPRRSRQRLSRRSVEAGATYLVTEVRGAPASYRCSGSGVPAIVTAGLGLSSRFYEESYAAFAGAGIRLLVPDLPGWGETPGPASGLSVEATTEFLIAFAAAVGVRRAVWIGHSLGAQAVVSVAVRRPDLAMGIALVGPTGRPGRFRATRQAVALGREAFRTTPAVIGAVAREYVSTSPLRYLGTWLKYSGDDMMSRLPRVTCPALVLSGDRDPIAPSGYLELLRHRLTAARVERVRGGTHALPRGHATEFNRVVTAWIREVSASGR